MLCIKFYVNNKFYSLYYNFLYNSITEYIYFLRYLSFMQLF